MKLLRFIVIIYAIALFMPVSAFCSRKTNSSGNPNWLRGVTYTKRDGISAYLWAPTSVIVGGDVGFFCYDGALGSVADYDFYAEARLSKMFNFAADIASRGTANYPDTFSFRMASHPTGFFSFWNEYRCQIRPMYHTASHHIVNMFDFYVDRTKWIDFHVLFGGALTFKDIDTRTADTIYKRDWFFFLNFFYSFKVFVHPVRFFSFGTVFGNYSDFEVNSMDFWQCDTIAEFYPTPDRRLALTAKFSVVNAGGLHFNGYIDRLLLSFGARYAIKL